ncbi:MAG: hypothetical protein HKN42_11320 [Granulosicoccus sp.]|nr:hypothetical protein [Granulosicoccus sp.]
MNSHRRAVIRFATAADLEPIRRFVQRHWHTEHIFVQKPELLQWQHDWTESAQSPLSFVIAENEHQVLEGILGFLPYRRFDRSGCGTELSLAMWKVTAAAAPGTGVALLRHLIERLSPGLILVIGINQEVSDLYDILGFNTGVMTQSVLLNPEWRGSRSLLANLPDPRDTVPPVTTDISARGISRCTYSQSARFRETVDSLGRRYAPVKTLDYLLGRYARHPYYEYGFMGLYEHSALTGILVWRSIDSQGSRLMRIVDFIGDFPAATDQRAATGAALRSQANRHNAEYIELMSAGIDEDCLQQTGFLSTRRFPDLKIPNYFEPFLDQPAEVRMAYQVLDTANSKAIRFFRADSDQDRPNLPSVVTDTRPPASIIPSA